MKFNLYDCENILNKHIINIYNQLMQVVIYEYYESVKWQSEKYVSSTKQNVDFLKYDN
jgi:hypothetical protein